MSQNSDHTRCSSIQCPQLSLQCTQTIEDISQQINRTNKCSYCSYCQCPIKQQIVDPLQRKREKRKENRKKQKARLKEMQEKALRDIENIIKDIYSRKTDFETVKKQVQECLNVQMNRDKFYQFINSVIRDQVQVIRKQISQHLIILPKTQGALQRQIIKSLFAQIILIKKASPQIEKILNLFVSKHFSGNVQQQHFQKNLDQMTYSFLVKNYLQKTGNSIDMQQNFVYLCQKIFQKQQYSKQRQLFQMMMKAYNSLEPQDMIQDDMEQGYQSDEEWEEESTADSCRGDSEEGRSRKKKRRRKIKEEYDDSFQGVLRRMENSGVEDRVECNVEEEWVEKVRKKGQEYRISYKQKDK